jgi:hypothetical protein
MAITFTSSEREFLAMQAERFMAAFQGRMSPLNTILSNPTTVPSLAKFYQEMNSLRGALTSSRKDEEYDSVGPVIKMVMLAQRRVAAAEVDRRRTKTRNPEMMSALDAELAPFDAMMRKRLVPSNHAAGTAAIGRLRHA